MAQTNSKAVESQLAMLAAYVDYVEVEQGMHPGAAAVFRAEIQAALAGDRDSAAWLADLFLGIMTNERTAQWMVDAQERAEEMAALRAELN